MVVIPDVLTALIKKGEITERYYNPGDLFDEIHLVLTNADAPDVSALQKTVGRAQLFIHNLPADKWLFYSTLGWRPWLLRGWGARAVALAEKIRPALIRCHGNMLNTYAASRIKQALGIPYVVSMHTNPDADIRGMTTNWRGRLFGWALKSIEKVGLCDADLVLPVYKDIVPYLKRLGVTHYEVRYNVLSYSGSKPKIDYRLHQPVRLISVGRQCFGKNPEMLIQSVASLPEVELTLIGDGDLHEHLKQVAASADVSARVNFIRSLPNELLCTQLPEYDIFAVHNDYWGIPKAVMEPMLAGLPIITNRRQPYPVSELTEHVCLLVENTEHGYAQALRCLIDDGELRATMGRNAFEQAQRLWSPPAAEARIVDIYRKYVTAACRPL